MRSTRLTVATLLALAGTCSAQDQTSYWNAASGNWSNPANWDPQNVPDASNESAAIVLGGEYTVTLDMSPTIAWVDIVNPGATLHLPYVTLTLLDPTGLTNDGTVRGYDNASIVGNITNTGVFSIRGYNQYLHLYGPTVTNHGVFLVNPEHSGYFGDLRFDADTTLLGTGSVQLDYDTAYLSTSGAMLTQGAGHTIAGRGDIRAALVNDGTVQADRGGATLRLNQQPKENNSVMRAMGGGILAADGVTIDQAGGGVLLAEDGSVVRLTDAAITGGFLDSAGAGVVEHRGGNSTLTGVTNNGLLNLIGYNLTTSVNGSGLHNDGSVVVNSDESGYYARVRYTQSGALDGSGTMTLTNSTAWLESADGVTVTHRAGHTIDGGGRVAAALVNDGTIRANRPGFELLLDARAKTNRSAILASGGATLRVVASQVTQTGDGIIRAEDGSRVVLQDALIVGGMLDSSGSGYVEHRDGNSTLRGVTNEGRLLLKGYNLYTTVDGGGLQNNGQIVVNHDQSGYFASLYFAESGALDGTGVVRMNNHTARLQTADSATVRHAAGHTIAGWGHIYAAMANNGLIAADEPGQELIAETHPKTNSSVMKASSGGTLRVACEIDQSAGGELLAEEGSRVVLQNARVIGGALDSSGSGYVEHRDGDSTLDGVTNDGLLRIYGYNQYMHVVGGLANNGEIVVNWTNSGYFASLYLAESCEIGGTGTITLAGPSQSCLIQAAGGTTGTIGPGQTLRGVGTLSGSFEAGGTIAPGFGAGTMQAQGSLHMQPGAVLAVELASTGSYDRLDGSAAITLGGTLDVAHIEAYEPGLWHQFVVVRGQSVSGEFDAITGDPLPGAWVYKVRYEPTQAVLIITCPPDTNADGVVNTLDFLDYLNLWTAHDPEADWNGDGVVNTIDFLAYLNDWVSGC